LSIRCHGDLTVFSRSHLTPPKDPASAQSTAPELSPDTARPLGRGGRRPCLAAGRRGWSTNTVQPETQETGEGVFHPLPVSPSPTGAILHRYSVLGFGSLFAASPNTPQRSCLRAIQGQSPDTRPPPCRGREETLEAPGGGGGRRIPFNQRHRRQGKGCSTPSPSAPPPRGRFSIDTVSWDLAVFSRPHLTPPKDPVSGLSRVNRQTLARPLAGGGRRHGTRREAGVVDEYRSTRDTGDRGRGVPPPPRQPLPRGAILHRYSAREGINHRAGGVHRQDPVSSFPCTVWGYHLAPPARDGLVVGNRRFNASDSMAPGNWF